MTGFIVEGVGYNEGSNTPTVDYDAMNESVIKQAGLEQRETLTGIITGIVDLGIQKQEDAEMVFVGTEQDEADAIAQMPDTYFKDGVNHQTKQPVRLKCWPVKDVQSVTLVVDFPDIMIDRSEFCEGSKPTPLRMYLGGQFFVDGAMIVGRPTPLNVRKNKNNQWSFATNHQLYKMAVASKIINQDDVFLPQQIDKLLGKSLQFEAQVFWKESKGKKYYTEYIRFLGGLPRGAKPVESPIKPFLIMFNADNDEQAVTALRHPVKNTIKRATNYEGSKISTILEGITTGDSGAGEAKQEVTKKEGTQKSKPTTKNKSVKEEYDIFDDDDIPF